MKGERVYLGVCTALIGWTIGYALPIHARLRSLQYDPQSRRWLWGVRPGAVAIGYYGQMLWALGAAAVCGALGLGAAVMLRRPLGGQRAGLWAAWTLTAVVLVAAWFTWTNWP